MKKLVIKTIPLIVLSFYFLSVSLEASKLPSISLVRLAKEKYPSQLPPVRWSHIFNYSVTNNKLSGLHSSLYVSPKDMLKVIKKNKLGVYMAEFTHSRNGVILKKTSTFFPDDWDEKHIKKEVEDAYVQSLQNEEVSDNSFIVTHFNGMRMKFWLGIGKNNLPVVMSIYPLMKIGSPAPLIHCDDIPSSLDAMD